MKGNDDDDEFRMNESYAYAWYIFLTREMKKKYEKKKYIWEKKKKMKVLTS